MSVITAHFADIPDLSSAWAMLMPPNVTVAIPQSNQSRPLLICGVLVLASAL